MYLNIIFIVKKVNILLKQVSTRCDIVKSNDWDFRPTVVISMTTWRDVYNLQR